ncbi:MAG: hypothetical protein MZV65_01955 [Chromatiales bacterium]|nr:hypothetical protein [Chromatiales bacterium]
MRGIRQQLGIAGFSDAIGPVLLEERRNLPDVRQYQRGAKERQQGIIQARLEQFQTEEQLRRARAVEEQSQGTGRPFRPAMVGCATAGGDRGAAATAGRTPATAGKTQQPATRTSPPAWLRWTKPSAS